MVPPRIVDDSFRRLFDKSAEIIHGEEEFEKAHETLEKHFSHLDNGNSRAVYEVPPKVVDGDQRLVVKFALPNPGKSGTEDALYPLNIPKGGWQIGTRLFCRISSH